MASFLVGRIEITPAATAALKKTGLSQRDLVARHQAGDWGDVGAGTQRANEFAAKHGDTSLAIRSKYPLGEGLDLVIVNGPDQSWTRIQLSSEQQRFLADVGEGYAMWAQSYARERNALIAVESPCVDALLSGLQIESALDVGTGTGRQALGLARRGARRVAGIDRSLEMLEVAKQAASREGLEIEFRQVDIEKELRDESGAYDLVVCSLMLTHISNLDGVASEFYRLLGRGGYVLITDIHPDVTKLGWGAEIIRPEGTFTIASHRHTRDDYLNSLASAGFLIATVMDVPFSEIPPDHVLDGQLDEYGHYGFCLIILAQKLDGQW